MKTEDQNESYAYFCLDDFSVDPDEITKMLGFTPTETWRKGDIHPKTQRERISNRWMLYSRLDRDKGLESHIDDVFCQLDAHREAVLKVCGQFDGYLQLVGYFYQYYPGFHLERADTIKMGEYRLGLDCDFYYLYSDQRGGTE